MQKIYSKIDPYILIGSYIKKSQINEYRIDISPDNEFVQVCARKLSNGIKIPAHKHLINNRETNLTQECWIILEGKVKANIYDLNDEFLDSIILNSGDCISLFRGGHSLETLEPNTYFYEIKNGPYYGVKNDKVSI